MAANAFCKVNEIHASAEQALMQSHGMPKLLAQSSASNKLSPA